MISRPQPNEYGHFYKGYIDKVPDGDIVAYLEDQARSFTDFLKKLPESKHAYSYEQGKWNIKEVVGHIIDTERIMASRILRFARMDKTNMPGFEQNDYVENASFSDRSIASLVDEFYHLRLSNLALIRSLSETEIDSTGTANEMVFSVRALIFILAGHLKHHWDILNERYLQL